MARRPAQKLVPSIDRFYTSANRARCLELIASEMGRLSIESHNLLPYQRELYEDLWQPLDEEALAQMLSYWDYNLDLLYQRKRGYAPNEPAKPRIDVYVEITSKGNLKAEWFPRGWNQWGPPADDFIGSDFARWRRAETRRSGYFTRPSNELFFLHGVEHALRTVDRPSRADDQPLVLFDHVLLQACHDVVIEMGIRLEPHFDVRMLTDVYVEWVPQGREEFASDAPPPLMKAWVIDRPEVRKESAERDELADLEARYGFSAEALLAAWRTELGRVRPSGPVPSPHTLAARLAKLMKMEGVKATTKGVERGVLLFRQYRAADCPDESEGRSADQS